MIKKLVCPRCGSTKGREIRAGLGACEGVEPLSREAAPLYGCLECHYEWGRKESLIPLITSIIASVGGYFGTSYCFEADRARGEGSYTAFRERYEGPYKTKHIPIPRARWEELLSILQRCDFEYWADEYVAPGVCDGTSWSVEVGLSTGERIVKGGSNEFPGKWDEFCEAIATFVGDEFS